MIALVGLSLKSNALIHQPLTAELAATALAMALGPGGAPPQESRPPRQASLAPRLPQPCLPGRRLRLRHPSLRFLFGGKGVVVVVVVVMVVVSTVAM